MPPIFTNSSVFRDVTHAGCKRDTPNDWKLYRVLSQLSYAPDCGPGRNRKEYYNTDLGFVKDKMPHRRSFYRR